MLRYILAALCFLPLALCALFIVISYPQMLVAWGIVGFAVLGYYLLDSSGNN
jgi:hypothetical protein